jgi:hypothetical protein
MEVHMIADILELASIPQALAPLPEHGARGESIRALQAALVRLGYDLGAAGVDGVYGDRTMWAHTRALWANLPTTRVWVFAQDAKPSTARELAMTLRDTGASDVVIFVDSLNPGGPLHPRWTPAEVEPWARSLRELAGVRVHLMWAPVATQHGVERLGELVRQYRHIVQPGETVILDVEENWTKSGNQHAVWADGVRATMDALHPNAWGVTAIPYLPSRAALLADVAPLVIPQTYARQHKDAEHQHHYEPGAIHATAAARYRMDGRRVVWGAAAYSQREHDVQRSMAAILRCGGREVAIWSSAWLARNPVVRNRFRALTERPT